MNKTIIAPYRSGELLRAGKTLTITGNALVQYSVDNGAMASPQKFANGGKIGPFERDITLIISAVSGSVSYSDSITTTSTDRLSINSSSPNYPDFASAPSAAEWYAENGSAPIWVAGQQYVSNGSVYSQKRGESHAAIDKVFGQIAVSSFAGRTAVDQRQAKGDFYAIRIGLENWDTSNTMPIAAACCAAVPTDGHNGTSMDWKTITFGGSASITVPVATGSGYNIIPSVAWSDVIYVDSIARTDDATKLPLIQIRSRHNGANPQFCQSLVNGTGPSQQNTMSGRADKGQLTPTDLTTTPSSSAATVSGTNQWCGIQNVIFYYKSHVIDIAHCGDSTFAGVSGNYITNWIDVGATLASTSKRIICSSNWSQASRTQTGAYDLANSLLFSAPKPKYLLLQSWSSNNSDKTATGFALAKQQVVALLDKCALNDIIPILTTSPILASYNSTIKGLLANHNTWVKSLPFKVFDIDAYLTDASGSGIKSAYDLDGTHYNTTGIAYLGGLFRDFIDTM